MHKIISFEVYYLNIWKKSNKIQADEISRFRCTVYNVHVSITTDRVDGGHIYPHPSPQGRNRICT